MKAMQPVGPPGAARRLPTVSWWLLGIAAALMLGGAWFILAERLAYSKVPTTSDAPSPPGALMTAPVGAP